jgi:VanZ family protein
MRARSYARLIVPWALTALCMVAIFLFSAAPADLSQMESGRCARLVMRLLHPDASQLSSDQYLILLDSYDRVIRKCAHGFEFAILGAACLVALDESFQRLRARDGSPRTPGFTLLCAVALCALYACTDEFHQLFVPGRAALLMDIGIDTLGALLGGGIATLVIILLRRHVRSKRR